MSFTAWYYPFFLAAVVLLYWRLPPRGRIWLLLAASYVFYGAWDARFLALIGFTTLVDFYCVGAMADADRDGRDALRRRFLWISIVSNLSVLFFFKYCNFFIESAQTLLAAAGLPTERSTLDILLPVGISFYTFQSIAYSVDVYRRQIHACRDLPLFATYIAFFPQLVAGPIERASHLLPQLERTARFGLDDLHVGLRQILVGFFKKLFVANNCALIANYAFSLPAPNGGWVVLGALAFAFQIYGDFSGYTDIARGSARLLGIRLCDNFRFPYSARGPSDFWQRWHISLSSWFRDYLYIPLGGNRFGNLVTLRNLFLTMLIAGLWHGAAWTFVLWGAFHGALLVLYRVTPPLSALESSQALAARLASVPLMFAFTLLGWIIFRANDADMLARMLGGLSDWSGVAWADLKGPTRWLALHIVPLLLLQFVTRKAQDESALDPVPAPLRGLLYWFLFMLTVSSVTIDVEFIYFQF